MTTAVLNLPKKALLRANWKAICFACSCVCLLLLVYYVFQIVSLTTGSYSIEGYEVRIAKLVEEKRDLEVNFAENSFLASLQEKVSNLDFQKTTSVKYIQLPDNYLARAK